ncbi:MAG: LacI family transcriptional regulator, partial [Erysipelotrichia bacterium]|nr:LacI family transcriptional regulator [Erysipelotrichia bacterium]
MRYKIAAIIGARRNAVIFPILEGIWECCAQENADLYAFVCYSSDSIDSTSSEGENNVFNLIQAEEYDGFILACQNIYSKTVNEKLQKLLLESGKPCISLEEDIDGMYYASIDNYSLMKEMTEHLINEHGCRILNYIGGPADNHENIARRNGFRSALKEAGIEPEERRIQSWSWDYTDGIEAFN